MSLLESYMQINEAARLLGVHPETVKRLCQRGALPAEKVRNTWLIPRDGFSEFVRKYQSQRRRGTGERSN